MAWLGFVGSGFGDSIDLVSGAPDAPFAAVAVPLVVAADWFVPVVAGAGDAVCWTGG